MRKNASAKKRAATLLILGVSAGCSDTTKIALPANKNSDDQSNKATPTELDPESLNKKMSELREQSAIIADRANEVSLQLSQLFSIKQKLCELQTSLFGQCYAHTPLAGNLWKQSAVCRKKVSHLNIRNFYAYSKGTRGRYQIILDNKIESNLINPNEETEIKWYSTGSRPLKDIKLSDISIFKVRAVDFEFPHDEDQTFTLKIDDKTLFTQADFLENSRTRKSVLLNIQPLRQLLGSFACRIEDSEVDEATEYAIASTVAPAPTKTPEELSSTLTEDTLKAAKDWNSQKNREIFAMSQSYLSVASDIARLRHDLRGDLQLGCWSNEPIRTIEFLFEGGHLPLGDWDRSAASMKLTSTGEPSKVEINLGGDLVFINNDENNEPIIRENGRLVAEPQTDLTIGDISSITITKKGVNYDTFQSCWSTWGGLGKACEWQNRENSRYKMDSLAIKINNEIIYSRENLNHTFERNSLVWFEKDLTGNQAYRDIMRRRDCPIH